MLSFNPLWHTLLDKGIKKSELCEIAGFSSVTLAKLGKNGNVQVEIIDKICTALNCPIEAVVEYIPKE